MRTLVRQSAPRGALLAVVRGIAGRFGLTDLADAAARDLGHRTLDDERTRARRVLGEALTQVHPYDERIESTPVHRAERRAPAAAERLRVGLAAWQAAAATRALDLSAIACAAAIDAQVAACERLVGTLEDSAPARRAARAELDAVEVPA